MALRPHGATAAVLLEQMRQPLLVLWGSHDRLVPPILASLSEDMDLQFFDYVA